MYDIGHTFGINMALIKENGTGLIDANCYADFDDFSDYAFLRNIDISAYSTEQVEGALYVAANDYIDAMHEFKGVKVSESQAMSLYTDKVTFDSASKVIISVNCEAALLQLKSALFVSVTSASALGEIKSTSSKLDVLEKSVEYVEGTAATSGTINTASMDARLRPFTTVSSGAILNRVY